MYKSKLSILVFTMHSCCTPWQLVLLCEFQVIAGMMVLQQGTASSKPYELSILDCTVFNRVDLLQNDIGAVALCHTP